MSEVSVALLRGINVGGRNSLPMAELRDLLAGLGAEDCRTYIQSGNAAFRGDVTAAAISDAIETAKGFRPHALVLPLDVYRAVLDACPYSAEGEDDGKSVHVYFADGTPVPPDDRTLALATHNETLTVTEHAAYLHAPDGIGRSKLAARLDKALGVPVTARNWKTAQAVLALAEDIS
ncbi:DUF1697 domain-containing protein [Psychromarinibacter sp. S121]|uniref:DUF1697 domain-containing protein n=1 Tax=Psychromarinibacter sp. S121 TaxID=3415127 RepID=UPI003C7C2B91